ncbi:MAG: SDR family oxidoreductase [Mariniphaga sp.]|nr:SDR family oxidoreductase [Mariniphaga sp.]
MNFCDLIGKTILITGASSGIGKQAAISITKQGGKVIISGRDKKKLDNSFAELKGTDNQLIAADLKSEDQIQKLVDVIPELNGIVHCAGIIGPTPAKFIQQENIDKMFRINFEVPVLLTAKILMSKKLQNNSSIVFISTVATKSPYFGGSLYNSSKSAIEAYSLTLALELANKGIRSNCISPGLVNTPLISEPAKEGQMEIVEDSLQRYLKKYPMGIGEPEDVANTIVFLLSDESKWISGTNITMGGIIQ